MVATIGHSAACFVWMLSAQNGPAPEGPPWDLRVPPAVIAETEFECVFKTPEKAGLGDTRVGWRVELLGASIGKGGVKLDAAGAGRFKVKAPKVKTRMDLDVVLRPVRGKPWVHHMSVYPSKILSGAPRRTPRQPVGLMGVDVKTRKVLEEAGIPTIELKTDLAMKLFKSDMLVLGDGQPGGRGRDRLSPFDERIRRGMWMLVLARSKATRFDDIQSVPHREAPTAVEADMSHPLLRAIPRRDVERWVAAARPAQILRIVGKPGESPRRVATRPRVDGPHLVVGFEQTDAIVRRGLLATRQVGEGTVVWCQRRMTQEFARDPIAQQIVYNVLRRIADERLVKSGESRQQGRDKK